MASNWIEDVDDVEEEKCQADDEKIDDSSDQPVEEAIEASEMDEEVRRILESHGLMEVITEDVSRSSAHLQACEPENGGQDEGVVEEEGRPLS